MEYTIYYYNKCSTCQKTKAIIDKSSIEVEYHSYFDDRLSETDLEELLKKLKLKPSEFIRKKDLYKELNLEEIDEAGLIKAMSEHPGLIQRPVLVKGDRAVVCRPPERALELINV